MSHPTSPETGKILASTKRKLVWHNLVYLVLTPIGVAALLPYCLYTGAINLPIAIFSGIFTLVTLLCITGGYHRYFSHRSYEASSLVKLFWIFAGAGAFQGSVLKWSTDHRRHHRCVDTEEDPYNINQGFFYAHMGWLVLDDHPKYKGIFEQDLARDKWIAFQHRYYVPLAFLIGFGFPTLVGWCFGSALAGFVLGGGTRLLVTNHSTFFINSLCHYLGRQPYTDENTARDSFILAIFTQGEGYHNYHHKFQYDYRNGIRWYHWDPTKWTLALLGKLNLVTHLKRAPEPQIVKARLKMEEKRLVRIGVPVEKLSPLREKVEEAVTRWRALKEDYRKLKANMQERSREKLDTLRQEVKHAKREFRLARMRWGTTTKDLRIACARVPSY